MQQKKYIIIGIEAKVKEVMLGGGGGSGVGVLWRCLQVKLAWKAPGAQLPESSRLAIVQQPSEHPETSIEKTQRRE